MKTIKHSRLLAALLTLCVLFLFTAALPLTAYAAPEDTQSTATETTAAPNADTIPADGTETETPAESGGVIVPNGANPPHEATGDLTANDFVFDNEQTGKQFVIFKTASGKVFYLVIDHDKATDNVFLLTEVGEDDLLNFVEVDENGNPVTPPQNNSNGGTTTPQTDTPAKNNNAGLILLVVAVLGIGGAAFYFFKKKKGGKSKPFSNTADFDFDDEDEYPEDNTAATADEKEDETE